MFSDLKRTMQKNRPLEAVCKDIFEWPEFQAFATRLGIPIDCDTLTLQITLDDPNQPAKIIQTV